MISAKSTIVAATLSVVPMIASAQSEEFSRCLRVIDSFESGALAFFPSACYSVAVKQGKGNLTWPTAFVAGGTTGDDPTRVFPTGPGPTVTVTTIPTAVPTTVPTTTTTTAPSPGNTDS